MFDAINDSTIPKTRIFELDLGLCVTGDNIHAESASSLPQTPYSQTEFLCRYLNSQDDASAPEMMQHSDHHQSCETPFNHGSSPTSSSGALSYPPETDYVSLFQPIDTYLAHEPDFSDHAMVMTISDLMTPLPWSWLHPADIEQGPFNNNFGGELPPAGVEAITHSEARDGGIGPEASFSKALEHNHSKANENDFSGSAEWAAASSDDNHNPYSPMSDSSLPDYCMD